MWYRQHPKTLFAFTKFPLFISEPFDGCIFVLCEQVFSYS